jgi:membrane-bound serine protease (ClpP class)
MVFLKGAFMEFLTDPNFAYVLLVLGFIFTLLAIVTPGTGLIELIALFALALSGYAAFKIGFNAWAGVLLLLTFIPFYYGIRKPKRKIYLVISLALMSIGSIYLYPTQGFLPAVNPVLAIGVSLVSVSFLWLVISKAVSAMQIQPQHGLDRLVGLSGETKTIAHDEGSVQVDGELWTARSEKRIPSEKRVRVLSREGFTLVIAEDEPVTN